MIGGWGISCEIALIWMLLDFTDDQSSLVQVMAWCSQAPSHYLSQCWPRSLSPYGVTRPQWVNSDESKRPHLHSNDKNSHMLCIFAAYVTRLPRHHILFNFTQHIISQNTWYPIINLAIQHGADIMTGNCLIQLHHMSVVSTTCNWIFSPTACSG